MKADTVLRIARPTERLEVIVPFYVEGLGMTVLSSFEDHEGFDGVMVGFPGARFHLEFTRQRGRPAGPAPSEDQLLVFYLPDLDDWRTAVDRMRTAGHRAVRPSNPWWDRRGVTFEDPDGCRVVLENSTWSP